MTAEPDSTRVELALDGPGAPPRQNGEVVFDEPWQGRAFAIAVSLCEDGAYEWSTFQRALIARVAEAEGSAGPYDYWGAWLAALGDVVAGLGLVSPTEIAARAATFADRPHGHDHP